MRIFAVALAAFAMVNVAVVVTAHPRQYINGIGDAAVVCAEHDDTWSMGGFCFPPGHIAGDENGEMTLSIEDAFFRPVSGVFCQDLSGDGICDTSGISFCGSGTFRQGVSWDPSGSAIVFTDGPLFGKPYLSNCRVLAPGMIGYGTHS